TIPANTIAARAGVHHGGAITLWPVLLWFRVRFAAVISAEIDGCIGRVKPVLGGACIVGTCPGVIPRLCRAGKTVVLVFFVFVVALQKSAERGFTADKVVGGSQADTNIQAAPAGHTIEIALGQNAQGLAEVLKQ